MTQLKKRKKKLNNLWDGISREKPDLKGQIEVGFMVGNWGKKT